MTEQTEYEGRRLSHSERQYLLRRLASDGIIKQSDAETLANGACDIPILLADAEVLGMYETSDKRLAEILSNKPMRMAVTIPASPGLTFERMERRERWFWAAVGAAGTLGVASVAFGLFAAAVLR